METREYDIRNCQSLIGYAAAVHRRSGGICQLCGCGAGSDADFDLWRQFTVEHVIGGSQGGYLRQIRDAIALRFPELSIERREAITTAIDALNTISACSFCNSTTSRTQAPAEMGQIIGKTSGTLEDVREAVRLAVEAAIEKKRSDVRWKLMALRKAFDSEIAPTLRLARESTGVFGQGAGGT